MTHAARAPAASAPSTDSQERWSLWHRILFRLCFVYLVLYCWPEAGRTNLLDAIPKYGLGALNEGDSLWLTRLAEAPWHALSTWVAVHVFHLKGAVTQYHPSGSGDRSLDYVLVFCFALIAILVAALWSFFDRRRPNYCRLHAWLTLLVRFTLAFTLLSYGFAKVFPVQFPPPFLFRLTESYGESSPMALLWTFMGASSAYTRFCGSVELTAGLLLLFRRTAVIGAIVGLGAMLNVAMLNLCYDVPVKLYSIHLLLLSAFLLLPYGRALARFLVMHQSARLEGVWLPKPRQPWARVSAIALPALVITSVLYNNISATYKIWSDSNLIGQRSPLYGIWTTDRFLVSGAPSTATAEASKWRQLTIDFGNSVAVRTNGGERIGYSTRFNDSNHTVKLTAPRRRQYGDFTYVQPDSEHLNMRGNWNGDQITVEFHRMPASELALTSRGFHWINENPFNH